MQNSTVNVGTAANALTFNSGITNFTLGGLTNSGNLSLLDSGSTAIALTVGNNNATTTYSGVLSGANASLTKVGTGSLTFSGSTANAYGDTIVQQGTLFWGKDNGVHAIAGNITLGKSTGGTSTDAAHLKLTADGQIADNSVITLYGASDGALYLQNHSVTVAGISGDANAQISNGNNGEFQRGRHPDGEEHGRLRLQRMVER